MLFQRKNSLQIDRTYTLEENGDLGCRESMISPLHPEQQSSSETLARFVAVKGLMSRDFIVFASLKDVPFSFFVWSLETTGQGLLLNSDAFDANPQNLTNQRMIDFVRAFNPDTLTQFGNVALNQLTSEYAISRRQ